MRILVTAASRQGSTLEIAEAIGAGLRKRGLDVTVAPPSAAGDVDTYDAVVVGSGVYRGRWLQAAIELVHEHTAALRERPVWLFSSGPIGDPARPIVQKMAAVPRDVPELLQTSGAREHRTFGGKLRLADVGPLRRLALRVTGLAGDWRQWHEIDDWARAIADVLGHMEWFRRLGEGAPGSVTPGAEKGATMTQRSELAPDPVARLIDVLHAAGVPFETIPHRRTTSAVAEAEALGVRPEAIGKTLVVRADARRIRVVVPASQRLDLQKLERLTGSAAVLLTEAELADELPEYDLGAVPPFGDGDDCVMLDASLAGQPSVIIEAGSHEFSLRLAPRDLIVVANAQVADVAA